VTSHGMVPASTADEAQPRMTIARVTDGWAILPAPEPSARDQLVALALHADDMPGPALMGALTATCGRMVDLVAMVDLCEAAPILAGLRDHSIDPSAVTDDLDRDAAIREWERKQDEALNRLLAAGGA
jgi:hypothetical protein